MKFSLNFKMDNEAFADYMEGEVKQILHDVGEHVTQGRTAGKVFDSNGNSVGEWKITGE